MGLEINIDDYCQDVSSLCKRYDYDILPGQVKEAIGAITNLYYATLVEEEKETLSVTTDYTLTSKYVSYPEITEVIEKATGFDQSISKALQEIMAVCFSDLFKEHLIDNFQSTIYFEPFGKFQLKKNDIIPEILMVYEDPNKEVLHDFMF